MLFDHRKMLRNYGVVEWRPREIVCVLLKSAIRVFLEKRYGLAFKIGMPCEEGRAWSRIFEI